MHTDPVTQSTAAKVVSQNIAKQADSSVKESTSTQNPTPQKPQSLSTSDTVTISNAAKIALQEAAETPTQTAKEAQRGDIQAKKLLAKQAAAEEASESPRVKAQEAG